VSSSTTTLARGGLPERKRMRHDAHYVDALSSHGMEPVGRHVPVMAIEPNPLQPRSQVGDLTELISSVKEKGVLEPLIVRTLDDGTVQLIAGERRLRAAQAAELKSVPCIEIEADDGEALEIALVENIQRRDLNPFEEADGFSALCQRFGHTHEQLASKLGRSRSGVSEMLAVGKIPAPVRDLCFQHSVLSQSALLQVARAGSREKMEATVLKIAAGGADREQLVKDRRVETAGKVKPGRPKHYRFKWQPEEKSFAVQVQFRKSRVSKAEVIGALRSMLEQLEEE
jgi:ParB family chromosome partitioning protein